MNEQETIQKDVEELLKGDSKKKVTKKFVYMVQHVRFLSKRVEELLSVSSQLNHNYHIQEYWNKITKLDPRCKVNDEIIKQIKKDLNEV